jgi:hypothetical protein
VRLLDAFVVQSLTAEGGAVSLHIGLPELRV